MMPGRISSGKPQVSLCALLLLLSSPIASPSLLNWRRDDALNAEEGAIAAASGPVTTDSATTATSPASTGTTTTATTAAGTDSASTASEAATTDSSNSTDVTNTTSTAAAAATSHTGTPLNYTNDPSKCHITPKGDGLGSPFCKPPEGQTILVNQQFEVTWDPSLFDSNSTNTIALTFLKDNGPSTDDIDTLEKTTVPNYQGATYLNLTSSSLNGSTTRNLSLTLSNAEHPHGVDGPTLLLSKANTTHSSSSKDPDKIGKVVGIPVGLVFLIALVALVAGYICMRRRRRGLGYGAGGGKAARSQRMAAAAGDHAGASRGVHRRDASFHDEPSRGMELQNRTGGVNGTTRDSWDWGSPVSSPTTAGGKNSNAFREEMQRQKSGRRG